MKNLRIEILVGLVVFFSPYILVFLGLKGTFISTLVGASLLCYGIYSIDPARMIFETNSANVPLNIYLVSRIGFSISAFSVYFTANLVLFRIFLYPWWLSLLTVFFAFSYVLAYILLISGMYSFQIAFIQLEYLDNLERATKIRCVETSFLLLATSWFLSVGGSDLMNFVILPTFIIYTLVRRLPKIRHGKSGSYLLKRFLDVASAPKKIFLTTFAFLAQQKKKAWTGYITFFCTVLLMINFRLYSLGNLDETLFLTVVFAPLGLIYVAVAKKQHLCVFVLIFLSFLLLGFLALYLPQSIPLIRFSKQMSLYPESEFGALLLSVFVLFFWIVSCMCIIFSTRIAYSDFRSEIEKEHPKTKKSYNKIEKRNTQSLSFIALGLQLAMSLSPMLVLWILETFLPNPLVQLLGL